MTTENLTLKEEWFDLEKLTPLMELMILQTLKIKYHNLKVILMTLVNFRITMLNTNHYNNLTEIAKEFLDKINRR